MFLNQITISDFDEITAFGFFNINLNLVIAVSTYLSYTNHILFISFEYRHFPMLLVCAGQ